ncbi:restriction endonuclease [Leptolyngbya sp. FACHB-36]|uniref:nucleotide-binding protein n=1 Tax=Leptolyngbya sp. FACHB-36 TaxID=2692808 RepID=UPI0016801061|nr:restriction endonuclease [Leptolyngbya sp. FACHB-36]MBD2019811.1 restriction endonuclease [Leptolyngbya sp. FACHB-36]
MPFENSKDFEKVVALLLTKAGWTVKLPPANTKGYDIEASKGGEVVAIQVKNYKAPVRVPQLAQFLEFLDLPIAARFTRGFFITSSGFSQPALTYFAQEQHPKARLAVIKDKEGKVEWISRGHGTPPPPPRREPLYLGVFTSKGGVGKTTVSAHLAGAFALSGYDVALIDLDPQKNLTTLLGEGIKLPGSKTRPGSTVTIYNANEWEPDNPFDEKIIVCDCSPVFEKNPRELVERFSYCLIPTTLNPLGLNKNGYVIRQTLELIRRFNKTAYLFVLINNYFEDETRRSDVLKEQYHRYFAELSQHDSRFKFIDPDEVAIRNSRQLFYWGYHIYNGEANQLAFNSIGGRCLPKTDFLNLLDYLEAHSTIADLKQS